MKRNRRDLHGCGVRPPGWDLSSDTEQDEDGDCSPPPARKILKHLLQNEVDKAVRELDSTSAYPKIIVLRPSFPNSTRMVKIAQYQRG